MKGNIGFAYAGATMTKVHLLTREAQGLFKLGLTRSQAANALGTSVRSLDRLVERGLLKPSRALRRPIFALEELQRFLKETE